MDETISMKIAASQRKDDIKTILQALASGKLTLKQKLALQQLEAHLATSLPGLTQQSSYIKGEHFMFDLGRTERTGVPEAILAQNKTYAQLKAILTRLSAQRKYAKDIFITRIPASQYKKLTALKTLQRLKLHYHPLAQMAYTQAFQEHYSSLHQTLTHNSIAVIAAGTSDQSICEEAAVTLEALGLTVKRIYDVGVAGLGRLLLHLDIITSTRIAIVVAGMDGALPGVLSGLVPLPIIAVPSSSGYGANFNGIAPLLTMLNACAPGIAVVNIDNGFGAAVLALKIIKSSLQAK